MAPYWIEEGRSPLWAFLYTRADNLLATPHPLQFWADVDWTTQPMLKLLAHHEDKDWLIAALRLSAKVSHDINKDHQTLENLSPEHQTALYKKQILTAFKQLLMEKMLGNGDIVWAMPEPDDYPLLEAP